jgi:hypothetical protein
MAKDPAFLFYSSDFLNGVADLTMEERGQFITLLCLQHQKGILTDKTIRLSLGSVSVDVLTKFTKDKDGNFFNERLQEEIEKRIQFTESRRNNGSKGGRPKNNTKPLGLAKHNLMEDVNENENEDINTNVNKEKVELPFESYEFKDAWEQFKFYKKKEFKFTYKTKQSERAALKELLTLSKGYEDIAIKIINQSLANGWKGLFNLKEDAKATTTNKPKLNKHELDNLANYNYIHSTSYGAGDYDRIFGGENTQPEYYNI